MLDDDRPRGGSGRGPTQIPAVGRRDPGGVRWFVSIGTALVVAGGLVAAVTGPTGWDDGSWVAAYLVLVGGVVQIALGTTQTVIGRAAPRRGAIRLELIAWNLGVVATIAGTLIGASLLSTIGGVATASALIAFLSVRTRITDPVDWIAIGHRSLAVMVLVSIPVGVTLAWIRHG